MRNTLEYPVTHQEALDAQAKAYDALVLKQEGQIGRIDPLALQLIAEYLDTMTFSLWLQERGKTP